VGTADGGDDAIEVGVGHGRPGRKAEAAIEQIFGHFSPLVFLDKINLMRKM